MKKFLPHIIILLVLGGIVAFYLFHENESTISKREAEFKVKDAISISKIILSDEKKHSITVEKKKGVWKVNDTYLARQDLIDNLLNILSKIESQAPVGKAAHDNVLREMLNQNIKVQVFTGGSKPKKTFYVGGSTTDGRGTYMLLEINGKPASRPQIVRVPGLDAYLAPAFEMKEEVWRSREVFGMPPENVSKISVRYPASPMQSFSVVAKGDTFELLNNNGETESVNQAILYSYCAMYEGIYIEAFDNENIERTHILKDTPHAILSVEEKDGDISEIQLFYMPINKRSKRLFDEQGNELLVDVDRFYALVNGKDFAIAQTYVFGKLLRKYQDFFQFQNGRVN